MKKLIAVTGLLLALAAGSAQAQIIGKITKVTASTSTSGDLVLEDTTGTGNKVTFIRTNVYGVVSGTTATDAKLIVRSKTTDNVLATILLNTARIVGASTQSLSNKIVYVTANSK